MVGTLIAAGISSVWQAIVTAVDMVFSTMYAILIAVTHLYFGHSTLAACCGVVLLLALSDAYHNQDPLTLRAMGEDIVGQVQHSGDYDHHHPRPLPTSSDVDPMSRSPGAVTTAVPPLSRGFASSTLLLKQAASLIVQAVGELADAVMESSKHSLKVRWKVLTSSLRVESSRDWTSHILRNYDEIDPDFYFAGRLAFATLMVSILYVVYHKATRHT